MTAFAGCASVMLPSDPPPPSNPTPTASPRETGVPIATGGPPLPREAWVEPADYAFTLESACGERSLIGTFRVTVRDHRTVAFQGLDDAGRRFQGDPGSVPTLLGILDEAEDATRGNASSVQVETDPIDGHPVSVAIDWMANTIDDEACYRLSDYEPP